MMSFARLVAALALAATVPAVAAAQDWPSRPIRFIVPFPAGGSTDVAARLIGEYLSRSLGQQVFIENRSGANGNVGIEAAARSASDGYTFLVGTDSVASNPHVYAMSIDVLKDLVPVAQLSHQPILLAAHPSLGVKSIAELVALAKRQPGLRYATGSGVGSLQSMVAQWFARIAGITLEQVPYRGGGQAINDLIAGHVKLGSLGSTPLIPHYRAGTLLLLAQSTAERSTSLPEIPTFQEAGIKDLVLVQWIGVFAPAGTPPAITARLADAIRRALAEPALRASLAKSAQDPAEGTTEEFARFVREEFEKYGRLVRELDIKAN
jgi:tripartite-type tricarboxylate transporter receptor subunit TctC